MSGTAQYAGPCPEQYYPLFRELSAWACLCPEYASLRVINGIARISHLEHWSRQCEWPWAIGEAKLEKYHTVLEVGGGNSPLRYAIARRCCSLYDLEYDREYTDKVQESIKRLGFANIYPIMGDARNLPCIGNMYDRVFCISVLEHIGDNGFLQGVKECIRVLKPGGIFLLTYDVMVEGKVPKDCIDEKVSSTILKHMGILSIGNNPGLIYSFPEFKIKVIMVKYIKD